MNSCIYTYDNNAHISLINDHPFTPDIRRRANHEINFRRICTHLINNGTIKGNIIDSGAWIGDNVIPWAMNIKGLVYAIDPSPANCEFINRMANQNYITNVRIFPYALNEAPSILKSRGDINHCSFALGPADAPEIEAHALSLDYLKQNNLINNIGFIHLDVEGFEFRAVKGAVDVIQTYRPIIAFEQHTNTDDVKGLSDFLTNMDYTVYIINEVLVGCNPDCRNFIAFPNKMNVDVDAINIALHLPQLITKV